MKSTLAFLDLADWLPEPVLQVRADGEIIAANRAAVRLLGLNDGKSPGANLADYCDTPRDDIVAYLRACSRVREPRPGTLAVRHDAEVRRFRSFASVQVPRTGTEPARLLLRLQPLSEAHKAFRLLNERIEQLQREIERRRAAEMERQRLETRLLHSQKLESLGLLAGGIAHDFNNILTSIIGYCDLARLETQHDTDAQRFIEEAITGARHAAELTQQLLAYTGKGVRQSRSATLSEEVQRIARLLEVSISKKCVLRLDLMPDQPPCLVDVGQLRQVIMNLIINASDAIGERSGVISVTTGAAWCDGEYLQTSFGPEGLQEGLYVTLEVSDTGIGMSPETQLRIFDPFFSTKANGRGLGLSAVVGIIRGHGGAIRVYSEMGTGTTFKILLPIAADAPGHTIGEATPSASGSANSGLVIVGDDEESIRAVARHMLTRLGYDVVLAADGREVLALYQQHAARDPLILLDMTMPHLDGLGTLRELRLHHAQARVVLMSGYSEQLARTEFVGKGLLGFVQKPFQFEVLARAVQQASRIDAVHAAGAIQDTTTGMVPSV